jgi:aspartyl/asparaginyl beta-hydroxylase (cupin superfamily)
MIRDLVESTLFYPTAKVTFFEPESYPWVADVESEWKTIRQELDAVMVRRDEIPNFQDLSEKQKPLTEGEQWKTFFLYGYGLKAEQNCERCPETVRILKRIPDMKTAMFSILAPKKHIPEHRGMWKGMLRYHLGLIIPGAPGSCRIRVGQEVRNWEEGKSLVFDDSHMHEAWNDSDSYRVVLFVDVLRPLVFPLSLVNRTVVWTTARTPAISVLMDRARKRAFSPQKPPEPPGKSRAANA